MSGYSPLELLRTPVNLKKKTFLLKFLHLHMVMISEVQNKLCYLEKILANIRQVPRVLEARQKAFPERGYTETTQRHHTS